MFGETSESHLHHIRFTYLSVLLLIIIALVTGGFF